MESRHHGKARVEALTSEMNAIHEANTHYWQSAASASLEARAEYKRRQDRLEEIRVELIKLQQK
jgi:hypothetical protein